MLCFPMSKPHLTRWDLLLSRQGWSCGCPLVRCVPAASLTWRGCGSAVQGLQAGVGTPFLLPNRGGSSTPPPLDRATSRLFPPSLRLLSLVPPWSKSCGSFRDWRGFRGSPGAGGRSLSCGRSGSWPREATGAVAPPPAPPPPPTFWRSGRPSGRRCGPSRGTAK